MAGWSSAAWLSNWAPYWWLSRLTVLRMMAHRMRYVTGIATYGIFVAGLYFIWKAIYAQNGLGPDDTLKGQTLAQLTTYLAIGYISRAAYFTNTDTEIAARLTSGDVSLDLLKPIDFHGQWLAQAAGETFFRILFFALPMALVLVPLFGVLPPSGMGWWQFPLLFLAAFWINAELNLLVGTAACWMESVQGLLGLKRNLIMLLSGLMVPLNFLPQWLHDSLAYLPFALLSFYPNLAYLNQLDGIRHPGIMHVFAVAVAWIIGLRLVNCWVWSRARHRLEVQGG